MDCNDYFKLLNKRQNMTAEQRRADIFNETFRPVLNYLMPQHCPGCRETLANELVCCHGDEVRANGDHDNGR